MIETYCSSHFSASSMYANSSALHQLVTCSSCWALHVLIQKSRVHTASLRRSVLPALSQYAGYVFVFRCDAPKHICLRHLLAYFSHRRKPSTDKMFCFFSQVRSANENPRQLFIDSVTPLAHARTTLLEAWRLYVCVQHPQDRFFAGSEATRRRPCDATTMTFWFGAWISWQMGASRGRQPPVGSRRSIQRAPNAPPLPTPSILTASPLHTCCLLP